MPKLKRLLLSCVASALLFSATSPVSAEVKIYRDHYGVPGIETETDAAMWMTLGFVQARDRIIQMEILRQTAFGELQQLDANDFIDNLERENQARKTRNIKVAHKYHNLRERLEVEFQKNANIKGRNALECFAQGVNAFKLLLTGEKTIDRIACGTNFIELKNAEPDKLSREELDQIRRYYETLKFSKEPWTPIDVIGLFHLQVMDEFSNRNTEMNNLRNLIELTRVYSADSYAVKAFNSMKWALNENAATSIPATPAHKHTARNKAVEYHSNLIRNVDRKSGTYNGCKIYNPSTFTATVNEGLKFAAHEKSDQFPFQASNWWVVSQSKKARLDPTIPTGVLYNGPQIAALDPARTYQVALKSKEGFQFAGNTYPGTINFWQGYNGDLAFGLTAGNIDVSDVFCVTIQEEDNSLYYRTVKGEKRYLKKARNSDLLHTKDTNWPVIAFEKNPQASNQDVGTAFIQRHNWQGQTVSTLLSWMDAINAKEISSWNKHLDTVGGNFNLVALNNAGVATYRLTGSLPIKIGMTGEFRSGESQNWNYYPSYDPRLPAAMAPDDGWITQGQHFHQLSHTIDNGILANWNQKPFVNMPDGDLDYDSYFRFDRVQVIKNLLRGRKSGEWNLENTLVFNGLLQRIDVNYFAYRPFLERLIGFLNSEDGRTFSPDKQLVVALHQIMNWSGERGNFRSPELDSKGAHYGHVIFYEWINALTQMIAENIANGDNELSAHLIKTLLKPKQPYFPKLGSDVAKATILTSHGIHMNSRILLNALHSRIQVPLSETDIDAFDSENLQYEYDQYQSPLITENPYEIMIRALKVAVGKTTKYKGYDEDKLHSSESAFFPSPIATFSGLSNLIGPRDVQVGFRKSLGLIRHFRNRGPLNIGVEFQNGSAKAKNVTHPGIREFRGDNLGSELTKNQLPLYKSNQYRNMFPLQSRKLQVRSWSLQAQGPKSKL